jgi:hypothetical protein
MNGPRNLGNVGHRSCIEVEEDPKKDEEESWKMGASRQGMAPVAKDNSDASLPVLMKFDDCCRNLSTLVWERGEEF